MADRFAAHWTGTLNLNVITLSFRSDFFARMLWFSIFSFGLTLAVFYLWLLLLSILAGPDPPPFHRLVRVPLGGIDHWSRKVKLLLPLIVSAAFWWVASGCYVAAYHSPTRFSSPPDRGRVDRWLNSYLVWKSYRRIACTHLLNSYIYFGKHPFWSYVNAEARTLLSPLRAVPLQTGKVDFAPV